MKNTQQQSVHLQNFGETGFNTVFFIYFLKHSSEVEMVVVGELLTEAKEFQQLTTKIDTVYSCKMLMGLVPAVVFPHESAPTHDNSITATVLTNHL